MLDVRLTQPRKQPLSAKVCLENIEFLELEKLICEDEARRGEIVTELTAWHREFERAKNVQRAVLQQSQYAKV